MLIKVTTGLLYNYSKPELTYKKDDIIKVYDKERAKTIIERNLGYEVSQAKNFKDFDPENKPKASRSNSKSKETDRKAEPSKK